MKTNQWWNHYDIIIYIIIFIFVIDLDYIEKEMRCKQNYIIEQINAMKPNFY